MLSRFRITMYFYGSVVYDVFCMSIGVNFRYHIRECMV